DVVVVDAHGGGRHGGHVIAATAITVSAVTVLGEDGRSAQRRRQRASRNQQCERKTSWLLHPKPPLIRTAQSASSLDCFRASVMDNVPQWDYARPTVGTLAE